jgi:hypothetical protein
MRVLNPIIGTFFVTTLAYFPHTRHGFSARDLYTREAADTELPSLKKQPPLHEIMHKHYQQQGETLERESVEHKAELEHLRGKLRNEKLYYYKKPGSAEAIQAANDRYGKPIADVKHRLKKVQEAKQANGEGREKLELAMGLNDEGRENVERAVGSLNIG